MSTLSIKELSHPSGEVIKIAAGKTLDLKSQGSVTMPTGSVLQVVNASSAAAFSTTSTAIVDTGFSASITPTSTSSKIIVVYSTTAWAANTSNMSVNIHLLRGSTDLGVKAIGYAASAGYVAYPVGFSYFDTPSTTNATTYSIWVKAGGANGTVSKATEVAQLTLMEIQG